MFRRIETLDIWENKEWGCPHIWRKPEVAEGEIHHDECEGHIDEPSREDAWPLLAVAKEEYEAEDDEATHPVLQDLPVHMQRLHPPGARLPRGSAAGHQPYEPFDELLDRLGDEDCPYGRAQPLGRSQTHGRRPEECLPVEQRECRDREREHTLRSA